MLIGIEPGLHQNRCDEVPKISTLERVEKVGIGKEWPGLVDHPSPRSSDFWGEGPMLLTGPGYRLPSSIEEREGVDTRPGMVIGEELEDRLGLQTTAESSRTD